jgi:hypothetical protein
LRKPEWFWDWLQGKLKKEGRRPYQYLPGGEEIDMCVQRARLLTENVPFKILNDDGTVTDKVEQVSYINAEGETTTTSEVVMSYNKMKYPNEVEQWEACSTLSVTVPSSFKILNGTFSVRSLALCTHISISSPPGRY